MSELKTNKSKMNDGEFLDYYCEHVAMVFDQTKEIAFIKDKELLFRYVSPKYKAKLPKTLLPKSMVHLKGRVRIPRIRHEDSEQVYQILSAQDLSIIKSREAKTFLFIDPADYTPRVIRKRPIINPHTGHCVGIFGTANPYHMVDIVNLIYHVNSLSYGEHMPAEQRTTLETELKNYKLNSRQHMVLFLYLNRYSNTAISRILELLGIKVSAARVNDYLESLKDLFQVRSKTQLISKAIALNYHVYLPCELLKLGSYELNDEVRIVEFTDYGLLFN